jgi:hypothetical protein
MKNYGISLVLMMIRKAIKNDLIRSLAAFFDDRNTAVWRRTRHPGAGRHEPKRFFADFGKGRMSRTLQTSATLDSGAQKHLPLA